MIAAELERRWEEALRELREAEEQLSRDEQHAPVWAIPADLLEALRDIGPRLPELWNSPRFFSWSQKKSLLRSLVDKVVLHRLEGHKDRVHVRVVWRGGAATSTDLAVSVGRFADRGDAAQIEAVVLRLARGDLSAANVAPPSGNAEASAMKAMNAIRNIAEPSYSVLDRLTHAESFSGQRSPSRASRQTAPRTAM